MTKRFDFTKLKLRNLVYFDANLLNEGRITIEDDLIRGNLLLKLEAWAACLEDERIVVKEEWPIDWWQAFKQRWFPKFWLNKYPVKTNKIDIDKRTYKAVCPHNLGIATREDHLGFLFNESIRDTTTQ